MSKPLPRMEGGLAPIAAIIIVILIAAGGIYVARKSFEKQRQAPNELPPAETAADSTANEILATSTADMATSTASTAAAGAANTQGETPREATVVYDAQGFSPKTVTIRKGDTVVFQNKTGKPMSVASDLHPTHTLYPEFDQYKTGQRDKDEFRFTFEKIGTWNYHDHLNATMTGTVVVTE